MAIVLTTIVYTLAAVCAGLMGFAIQRGATCTVAAVDEIVSRRRAGRLVAMVEAAVWVAGGLLIARALHVLPAMPRGFAVGGVTVAGGALLGIGAYVNRACVFGAIARLGSGEWAYLATPAGFYAGCLTVDRVFAVARAQPLAHDSPVLAASMWLVLPFALFALWRIVCPLTAFRPRGVAPGLRARLREAFQARAWTPHAATTVIGITFVVMLLLVGAWAYTDALAELAHGMSTDLLGRTLLLVALFAGAVGGGLATGGLKPTTPTLAQVGRCFFGGVLMGWGSLLIPGSNDALILVGMPLLRPYAWVAFATMVATIGAALLLAPKCVAHRTRSVRCEFESRNRP
jgi:toxin CptA